jgi:hypothetical protein
MRITGNTPITANDASFQDTSVLRQVRAQVRALGNDTGGQFAVVRDPATQRFVVQVLDPNTRAVLDQFPAESILKQLPPDQ